MNKLTSTFVVAAMVVLSGCAAQVTEAGYYWGNYSKTLYTYTKDPSEEALEAHLMELERIVEESNERDLRVPPGIHAEIGYIRANLGENALAMSHYEAEMSLYPESRLFLERLTQAEVSASNP